MLYKYNKFSSLAYLALFIGFVWQGCRSSNSDIPDISNIKLSLQTYRFDKDLYAIDTNHIAEGLKELKVKYPGFLDYYLDTLHEYGIHGNYNDTVKGIREDVRTDLTFKDFVDLEDTILKDYPNNKDLDEELTNGFRFLRYYFPTAPVPQVIYLNMGLSKWPSFPVDTSIVCVGLDMFLGEHFPYYSSIGVPPYMAAHLRKSYIPVSVFHTIYETVHPWRPDDKTLLELMLIRGKEQYYLHKILPYTPDSVLFGFTAKQLQWCNENEALIYNFFIQQNLLYSRDALSVMPYVNDGPYAKGLEAPDDPVKITPGNIGGWLGYRIVCGYMAQYPKTTLKELLEAKYDPTQFVDKARYRPK